MRFTSMGIFALVIVSVSVSVTSSGCAILGGNPGVEGPTFATVFLNFES